MTSRLRFLFLGLVPFLLVGCFQTREEIREAEQKRALREQVATLQQGREQDSVRTQEFDEQFRVVNGRLDTLEHQVALNKQSIASAATDRERAAKESSDRFRAYEEELTKLQGRITELNDQLASLKKSVDKAEAASKDKDKDNFKEAEGLFDKKEWKSAIVAYQKYRDRNPKGKKYPEATYKIGVSFQELGMKSEARAFYEEVIEKYPGAKEAKKAATRLKSLKPSK